MLYNKLYPIILLSLRGLFFLCVIVALYWILFTKHQFRTIRLNTYLKGGDRQFLINLYRIGCKFACSKRLFFLNLRFFVLSELRVFIVRTLFYYSYYYLMFWIVHLAVYAFYHMWIGHFISELLFGGLNCIVFGPINFSFFFLFLS